MQEHHFAANLRKYRRARGYTQAGLALRVGVHPHTIKSYELGYIEPKLSRIADFAQIFQVPICELLTEDCIHPAGD